MQEEDKPTRKIEINYNESSISEVFPKEYTFHQVEDWMKS